MARRTASGPTPGYHEGEIAVQQRAEVHAEARPLVRMLDPAELVGGIVGFLAQRTFIVLTARDDAGVLWVSPLRGPEGFLAVTGPNDLHIATAPSLGDPLHRLPAGQQVGMVTMEFAKRRRFRLNGRLWAAGRNALSVEVAQAYGNCPQYIQQRSFSGTEHRTDASTVVEAKAGRVLDRLSEEDMAHIRAADTFFLGTTHPSRGNDASHRGGPPRFVRVQDHQTLWWPDYPGNNMFNSLGNLAVDDTAALLFIDFATGRTLHLTGRATLQITTRGTAGDDGHTGRRVHFQLAAATAGVRLPRATSPTPWPRHPPLLA